MNQKHHMHSLCQQYLNQHVQIQTQDHQMYQGIVESVDNDNVYLLIPDNTQMEMDYSQMGQMPAQQGMTRQWGYGPGYGYPGYGYPGYGYPGYGYPGYGYPYYPRPRYRRLALPLAALGTIALLPFLF